MKCKKLLALVMAAVLSVSMLTACGGGSGVKDTLSSNGVEKQLEEVDIDIDLTTDSHMNNVVRAAAQNLAAGSSRSTVTNQIMNEMNWDALSQLKNVWNQILGSMGILTPSISVGLVQIVSSDQLAANQGSGGLLSLVGTHRQKVLEMSPINTPEKFAAALLLGVDGTVGMISDAANDIVNVGYNVCGYEVEDPNGNDYWVFAAQITIA